MQGFAVAKATHHQLLQDVIGGIPVGQVLMEENDDIRRRLHQALHISPQTACITLFPSGSDAELVPTITALVRSHGLSARLGDDHPHPQTRVFNFIAGAGEVGSGTAKASGARHFSNTPNALADTSVADGVSLEGITEGRWRWCCFCCFVLCSLWCPVLSLSNMSCLFRL
jgi:hypothetical protein